MSELNGNFNGVDSSNRVHDWETGLPNVDEITPLSYGLLSPELLSAFNIKPEPYRTSGDVTQASEKTISSLRATAAAEDDGDVDDARRNVSQEDADSAAAEEAEEGEEKAAKKARLVWTPQLHRRFVEVVAHLGIKNAVPKTIMQLMNVEGLSRENVASHLQKYRLYLKRNQGFGFDSSPSVPAQAPVAQVPVPVQSNNNNYNQFNYNNNNGVMQTGNNMYGSIGVSYHQNHLNHHHNMQK